MESEPISLINLCAVSSTKGGFLSHKVVAVGIEGELDALGNQRWYLTPELLNECHPGVPFDAPQDFEAKVSAGI